MTRRIALFVEGESERPVNVFLKAWLDRRLPADRSVGIKTVVFHGVSHYLDEVARKLELTLQQGRANVVFGLIDLYGMPQSQIDLSGCESVRDKVARARELIRRRIPEPLQSRFRQHFAVHEIEAWLLAYPETFPREIRSAIPTGPPESVNFDEPPSKLLQRIMPGRYKKTVHARNVFTREDPQVAIDRCPYLRILAEDLLAVATQLTHP